MAKVISNPLDRLCDGFLKYRLVRSSLPDIEKITEALSNTPNRLLQMNLMFLVLGKMRCSNCKLPCSTSNCPYSPEMTVAASEILNQWQKPTPPVIRKIKASLSIYMHGSLMAYCSKNMSAELIGSQDEQFMHDIHAQIEPWNQRRKQMFFDMLDGLCRLQPCYLELMK